MLDINLDHLSPSAKFFAVPLLDVRIPATNPKQVVLHMAFCGKGSRYWNTFIKWKPIADDDAANQRVADALARHGVVGWENVEDGGKPVAFSHEGALKIFDALIRAKRFDKIDLCLAHALNPDNYTEALPVEAGELGKS